MGKYVVDTVSYTEIQIIQIMDLVTLNAKFEIQLQPIQYLRIIPCNHKWMNLHFACCTV